MQFGTFNAKEIILASHKTKICDLSPIDELKQALRYVMTLTGLKSENWPSESQKMVLLDFAVSELGNFTPDEIRIAFKLASSKKINCEIEHYQNFNASYLGKVMAAYSDYKVNAMREFKSQDVQKTHEISQEEKTKVFYEFVETFIVSKFELYKATGRLEGTLSGFGPVFNTLEKDLKLLVLTIEEKQEIYNLALELHKKQQENKKASSKDEARKMRQLLEKTLAEGYEKVHEYEIKNLCYWLSVKNFYEELRESKRDLRQIVEQIKQEQYE